MRLFLVRHAQTAWNVIGRAQGSNDTSLDETGMDQAKRLGRTFANIEPLDVFSSDLKRCQETAQEICSVNGGKLHADKRLRERSGGDLEGLLFPEFRARLAELQQPDDPFGLQVRPPNGESIMDTWQRVATVADELRERNRSAVVVSHGAASALLLANLLGAEPIVSRSFRFDNAAIFELARNNWGLFALERYNDTSHLAQPSLIGTLDGSVR